MKLHTQVAALSFAVILVSQTPVHAQYYPRWDPEQRRVIQEPVYPRTPKPRPLTREERCRLNARGPLAQEQFWNCMRNTRD